MDAYGAQVFLALSAVGALFLLPFAVNNFVQQRWLLGSLATIVALCLVGNAVAIGSKREAPFPPVLIFGPALVGLGVAMYEQGLIGILWSYAALLLFHFVLPRGTANFFNATIIVLATVMSWTHLGPAITLRVTVTLVLTLLFANIFSWMSEAQRRKEAEHRERLDLLVRGTNAGTLEWDADGTMRYSARLRRMLGRKLDGDQHSFMDIVHPEDRQRVEARVLSQFAQVGPPMGIVPLPPDDFRLLHASGSEIWVHTEGIAVTDSRGRTRRCVCSFLDMTERVQAELSLLRWHEQVREQARQLEEQNTRLREAMRMREEVERIARHDLKTPLASIASVPRMLREGGRFGPREEELLAMVEHGALRVLSMVNLSLDLYRMEEGSYRLRPQPVDIAQVARTVARELHGHADTKRVSLHLDLALDAPAARGEDLLCYSTVANLMKNAVEAAPDGSTVRITVRERDGRVELELHNQGVVPEPVRATFFEKYATHGKAGGTGLGAYSARLMARVQGGDLRMATAADAGTTLTLVLPAWNAASQPAVQAVAEASTEALPAPGAADAWPPLSLLLVDDDPYNLIVLKSLLPVPPLKVREAINGRAALECVAAERPDIVFLDLQMPVMGGPETIGRIRELQRELGHPPSVVVAFSAWDDEVTRNQCAQAGFDHYIVKPASREEVLAILRGRAPVDSGDDRPEAVDAEALALMPEFVESRRMLLGQLREAAEQGDRRTLHATAHMLTGSLGMYGFDTASEMSRRITAHAQAGELGWLRERCNELSLQFEQDQVVVQQGMRC